MDTAIAWASNGLLYAVAFGAALGWLFSRKVDRVPLAISVVVGAVSVLLMARVASALWYDPRPFVVDGVEPLVPHAADNGFPSDTVSLAMAVALAVMLRRPALGAVLAVIGLVLGSARVLAGLHHWPDIVGGVLIGAVAALIGEYTARWWVRREALRSA